MKSADNYFDIYPRDWIEPCLVEVDSKFFARIFLLQQKRHKWKKDRFSNACVVLRVTHSEETVFLMYEGGQIGDALGNVWYLEDARTKEAYDLGPVEIHRVRMTVAPIWTIASTRISHMNSGFLTS